MDHFLTAGAAWPLHDIATTNMVCGMAEQGGGGITIDCAILIATYSGGGGARKEVRNAKNSIGQCTISETPNEYLVKAKGRLTCCEVILPLRR